MRDKQADRLARQSWTVGEIILHDLGQGKAIDRSCQDHGIIGQRIWRLGQAAGFVQLVSLRVLIAGMDPFDGGSVALGLKLCLQLFCDRQGVSCVGIDNQTDVHGLSSCLF